MKKRDFNFAVIGDLVRSREVPNRKKVQNRLLDALDAVNDLLDPIQALEPTIGDEYQGVFEDISSAVRATLLLRLELLKRAEVDSRYGIGVGEITIFDDDQRRTQEGSAWWSARAAIEKVEKAVLEPKSAFLRTRFEVSEKKVVVSPLEAASLNGFLATRDALVDQMSPRSRRLLLGLLDGKSQSCLAKEEGIYQSAVSQNLSQTRAYSVLVAESEIGRVDR
jgi:hypothetical protein